MMNHGMGTAVAAVDRPDHRRRSRRRAHRGHDHLLPGARHRGHAGHALLLGRSGARRSCPSPEAVRRCSSRISPRARSRGAGSPTRLIVLVVVFLVAWVPIRWRRPGLALYALGSNRNSTFLSGMRVSRTRIGAYALGERPGRGRRPGTDRDGRQWQRHRRRLLHAAERGRGGARRGRADRRQGRDDRADRGGVRARAGRQHHRRCSASTATTGRSSRAP